MPPKQKRPPPLHFLSDQELYEVITFLDAGTLYPLYEANTFKREVDIELWCKLLNFNLDLNRQIVQGRIDIVNAFFKRGHGTCTDRAFYYAVRFGHTDTVKYLVDAWFSKRLSDNGCIGTGRETNIHRAIKCAIQLGYNEMAQHILENICMQSNVRHAWAFFRDIATSGNLTMLRWLHEKGEAAAAHPFSCIVKICRKKQYYHILHYMRDEMRVEYKDDHVTNDPLVCICSKYIKKLTPRDSEVANMHREGWPIMHRETRDILYRLAYNGKSFNGDLRMFMRIGDTYMPML